MKRISPISIILIATIILTAMFFSNFYNGFTPFLILNIICFILSLLSIFLIHHRTLQMRFCIYNSIVLIALQIWALSYYFSNTSLHFSNNYSSIVVIFPIIAAILFFIAIGIIRRDIVGEKLINNLKKNKKK